MNVRLLTDDAEFADELVAALKVHWPHLQVEVCNDIPNCAKALRDKTVGVMFVGPTKGMGVHQAVRRVRQYWSGPVVAALDEKQPNNMMKVIDAGADDFVSLPLDSAEAVARVVALTRRVTSGEPLEKRGPIELPGLLVKPTTREVFLEDEPVHLTPTEFRLLFVLLQNHDRTLTHGTLQQLIWGDDEQRDQELKKYVQRVRRKLGDDRRKTPWIRTVHGIGYRMCAM